MCRFQQRGCPDQANVIIQHYRGGCYGYISETGCSCRGFKTVGQIHATNDLVFQRNQNAMGVAVELLSTHTPGAPVVDERGEFVGFVSEFDILRALEAKKDLNRLSGR